MYEWARINELLDKQLYLTRLESKNRDMYFEETSLKRLVIDEIQLTRHISQAKGIGYDLDLETNLDVYTDVKWCRMMIRQILSNSLKYSQGQDIIIRSYTNDGHVTLKLKILVEVSVTKIYHVYLSVVSLRLRIVMKQLLQE